MSLVRVEIIAYCMEDCDSGIDRTLDFMREAVNPELIIVGKSDVDEARLAELLAENADDVVPD